MRRTMLLVLVLSAFTAVTAGIATGATSLAGEHLRNTGIAFVTEFTCDASGARIVFTASGDAVAPSPYPGTWEESVVLTAGPLSASGGYYYGTLSSFQATFHIDSGDTIITGTKQLSGGGSTELVCRSAPSAECIDIDFSATGTFESLTYDATIAGPGGTGSDTGTADFHADAFGTDCAGDIYMLGSMLEEFVRSTAVNYDAVCARARDYSLDPQVAESLCEMLAAAEAAEDRGDNDVKTRQLDAFAHLVDAQTGKALTAEEATDLLSLIRQL
jgi:hypothetical protein